MKLAPSLLESLLQKGVQEKPLLSVENLSASFSIQDKELSALRGISFSIQRGSSLGIVGESGCGKSTIAKAITQLASFSKISGKILFQGRDLLTLSLDELCQVRGKEIGYIFQDPMSSLNPTMKIGRQVEEAFLHHKMGSKQEAKEKSLALFDLLGIADPDIKLDAYPHQLSGGQRQRVLIAMALITEPSLLIADEPTTALDVILTAQTLSLLKKVQSHFQTTLLLITHDLNAVKKMCDQVLVLYAGKIVEMGKTEEVLNQPKHPYTQLLSASIPSFHYPKNVPLKSIEGLPPDLSSPISGCSFKERCPFQIALCDLDPPFKNSSACWRASEKIELPHAEKLFSPPSIKEEEEENLLEVKNLSKSFKGTFVVKNISFAIKKGEVLSIIGESGSGKSTLAKMIVQLLAPTSGEIFFEGDPLQKTPHFFQKMQMIFQDPFSSLNPRMTVKQILDEPCIIHKRECRTKELLDLVGLPSNALLRYPHEFSGGQRQRIGIARALALNPLFLVCDEPISALDVSIQAQIINLLKSLQQQLSLTYLFIGHNLPIVRYLSTHVAVMYGGKIVEMQSASSLFENPMHSYTRKLCESAGQLDA